MEAVLVQWPIACEVNLSNTGCNRQAWIGQAACSLAVGAVEESTRAAWNSLTPDQQDIANRIADEITAGWEAEHA